MATPFSTGNREREEGQRQNERPLDIPVSIILVGGFKKNDGVGVVLATTATILLVDVLRVEDRELRSKAVHAAAGFLDGTVITASSPPPNRTNHGISEDSPPGTAGGGGYDRDDNDNNIFRGETGTPPRRRRYNDNDNTFVRRGRKGVANHPPRGEGRP